MFTFKQVLYKDILNIDELHIDEKSITALIGESGTGKSTLLKLMNHLITCTDGTISYKGTPVEELNAVKLRRDAAMLSQTPVLFGETVRENLEAGLLFSEKTLPSEKEMIDSMHRYYLEKNLDDKADKLSGGEQQRLALARITLLDPEVFLLDEPTSALDDELEHDVMEQFMAYAQDNEKTVIFVTHSQSIAEEFSDTIIDITPHSKKGRDHTE
ncbi:ATP-binding cassette domain-containing protein [Salibacterium salarium]|uniref:ATP-binding cassette domain-containing protein n=1 Tax=Salibacterium salarium TaxID=284579 RepID=A0A428N940_9BACI|nr:ATP-binding cassette domain-containing protein [Salibacterium salarium]RSL34912.1 ATP-binding cassette domain-containing protein [Salibacterium salarium]